jgi:hypothetical protein
MFKRMDEIAIEIPEVEKPDPNAAAAVQELLGGKFGEMSTWSRQRFASVVSFSRRCPGRDAFRLDRESMDECQRVQQRQSRGITNPQNGTPSSHAPLHSPKYFL